MKRRAALTSISDGEKAGSAAALRRQPMKRTVGGTESRPTRALGDEAACFQASSTP